MKLVLTIFSRIFCLAYLSGGWWIYIYIDSNHISPHSKHTHTHTTCLSGSLASFAKLLNLYLYLYLNIWVKGPRWSICQCRRTIKINSTDNSGEKIRKTTIRTFFIFPLIAKSACLSTHRRTKTTNKALSHRYLSTHREISTSVVKSARRDTHQSSPSYSTNHPLRQLHKTRITDLRF